MAPHATCLRLHVHRRAAVRRRRMDGRAMRARHADIDDTPAGISFGEHAAWRVGQRRFHAAELQPRGCLAADIIEEAHFDIDALRVSDMLKYRAAMSMMLSCLFRFRY